MGAIGAGIAVWGAWQCVYALLSDSNTVARDMNRGCVWLIGLFAVFATGGLIEAL